jgi:two-component system, cell cycle sensor histidine kinase and response regulator CckA
VISGVAVPERLSSPWSVGRRRFPPWFGTGLAMGALLLVYGSWQLFRWGPPGDRVLIGDTFFYPVSAMAVWAAWRAGQRCAGWPRLQRAWRLLALSAFAYLLGDIAQTVYELLGNRPYSSPDDALYLIFYPLMLAGLLSFPVWRRDLAGRIRLALDIGLVALGGSALVIYLVLGPTAMLNGGSALQDAISVAYPVGDMVLLVGLASLLLRGSAPSARDALLFLGAGLLLYVVADLIYGYLTLHSSYKGGDPVDTLWMVAIALFAVAGAAQRRVEEPEQICSTRRRVGGLPYLAVAIGFSLLVYSDRNESFFPGVLMTLIAMALAGLLVIRQFVSQRELVGAQQEVRYQAQVIENSRDVLSVLDLDGTVRFVSQSVEDATGYSETEPIGHHFAEFVHPDDRRELTALMDAAARGETTPLTQCRMVVKDGSTRVWEGTVALGRGMDGEPTFLVWNSRDVTDRAELEDQLRQAQKMEVVGRLAGGVAHDFNNLLLVIRGYSELALEKVEARDDNTAEIGEVIAATDKAASLTAQLLAFSRRQILTPEPFALCDAVDEMTSMLQRLIGDDIELATFCPDRPTLINADRAQIGQVIANLAVNARDAMPNGGHLRIEVVRQVDPPEALLIVRDDGVGMDTLTAAQIFDPFFTTKGSDGTGLGLSTVHGIITQTGGRIAVDSRPGQGTTFTISLPVVDPVDAPPALVVAPADGGAETILLAEDNAMVARAVSRMLLQHGYRMITVESGEEAIEFARNAPGSVDLLLTDLVMRGLNGRQAAEVVLRHQPHAKVLYMSGYTEDVVIRVGHFEPGTAFIQKPFSGEELARRVRELLDSSTA